MPKIKYKTEEERKAAKKRNALAHYYRKRDKYLAYSKEYALKNREKILAKGKAYDKNNAERIKERKRLYRLAKKEERAKYLEETRLKRQKQTAEYYKKNKEKLKANAREWRILNPEKARLLSAQKRAVKRKAIGKLSKDIAEKLMRLQKGLCVCCRVSLAETEYHIDHIIPLSKGGAHTDTNVQLLCQSCNCSKQAKDPIEFMQSRGYLL